MFVCLLACLFVRLFDFLCFSAGLSFLSVFLGFFLRVQWFRFRIQGQGLWFRDFGFGAAASRIIMSGVQFDTFRTPNGIQNSTKVARPTVCHTES